MTTSMAPVEAWCAAHLNWLCTKAVQIEKEFQSFNTSDGKKIRRGMLIPYDSLPGSMTKIILPLFRVKKIDALWLKKMIEESRMYSKGKKVKAAGFMGDSEEKNKNAPINLKLWAGQILNPIYEVMRASSNIGLEQLIELDLIKDQACKALPVIGKTSWDTIAALPRNLTGR